MPKISYSDIQPIFQDSIHRQRRRQKIKTEATDFHSAEVQQPPFTSVENHVAMETIISSRCLMRKSETIFGLMLIPQRTWNQGINATMYWSIRLGGNCTQMMLSSCEKQG